MFASANSEREPQFNRKSRSHSKSSRWVGSTKCSMIRVVHYNSRIWANVGDSNGDRCFTEVLQYNSEL